ncbi:MAG: hypothetical protein JNL01_15385 [Bdellovibrionales bacterium]|nr:hypothetical protein [Bdellovibrionales bacterium]
MTKLLLTVVATFALSTPAQAKPESWYWGFHLGGGSAAFNGTLGSKVSTYNSNPSLYPTTMASKLFFLWPISEEGLLGVSSGGAIKFYSNDANVSQSATAGQSMLTLSYMHRFGPEHGRGWYFKGDAGMGVASAQDNILTPNTNLTRIGLGFCFEAGYGIGLSDETALLIGAEVGGASGNSYYAFSVGPLF